MKQLTRSILPFLLLGAVLTGCSRGPAAETGPAGALMPDPEPIGTIVIVHGAWGGGWAWREVDGMLRAAGYDVLRPTLTGLGERVHLANPHVDLSTHVQDVVNALTFEQLEDVVLVGHSYGGMVITGVAEEVPERLRRLVYLDAFVPLDGESVEDLMPGLLRSVRGDLVIPTWADPQAPYPHDVPHPLGTLTQSVDLAGAPGNGVPATYIHTREEGAETDSFDAAAERAAGLGWTVRVFPSGHNPQNSAPAAIAALLAEIAAAP